MLFVIRSFGEDLPPACRDTIPQTWSVFDNFLTKYGTEYDVAERANRVIRHGITFYGQNGRPVAGQILLKLMHLFEKSQISSYLWICGKVVAEFGHEADEELQTAILEVYQRSTQAIIQILLTKQPTEIPDRMFCYFELPPSTNACIVLEDYVHLMRMIMERTPSVFFTSPTFEMAFKSCIPILGVVYNSIVEVALDLFRDILAEAYEPSASVLPSQPSSSAIIQSAFQQSGMDLLNAVIQGVVGDFYEEKTGVVVSILRSATKVWPKEVIGALPAVLQSIPNTKAPADAKNGFLTEMTR